MRLITCRRLFIAGFVVLLWGMAACKKDGTANGSLKVIVEHNGIKINGASVYLNRDSTYHPDSLNDEYDKMQKADAIGEVVFHNLMPGTYYVYAAGFERDNHAGIEGADSIIITDRQRQNDYELKLHTTLR
ncbi:hypothetical protein [Mucilaginibacter conchicola]|nr:hypothetical protein [Mucilaginibacter conchicola]